MNCDLIRKDAYIRMSSDDEAKLVLSKLNELEFHGQNIFLEQSRQIYITSLVDTATEENVRLLFQKYGSVEDCCVGNNCGSVLMSSDDEAKLVLSKLNELEFHGQNISLERSSKVFIHNVVDSVSEDDLRSVFQPYGTIIECSMAKNYSTVLMGAESEARQAVENLNERQFLGHQISLQMGSEFTVNIFHYLLWDDFSIPRSPMTLVGILLKASSLDGDLLGIHCAGGTGRTFTAILLHMLLLDAAAGAEIDMFQRLKLLRSQRYQAVETDEQFLFAVTTLHSYLTQEGKKKAQDFISWFTETKDTMKPSTSKN